MLRGSAASKSCCCPVYCHGYNRWCRWGDRWRVWQACWDLDDDPRGNVQHIAEHDVSKEEVEEMLEDPDGIERSRTSGLLIAFGETSSGRLIAVVFEEIGDDSVYPVTAYEID